MFKFQVLERKIDPVLHFARYHGWMEDALLRAQTASERLTLEQERTMQQSWLSSEESEAINPNMKHTVTLHSDAHRMHFHCSEQGIL